MYSDGITAILWLSKRRPRLLAPHVTAHTRVVVVVVSPRFFTLCALSFGSIHRRETWQRERDRLHNSFAPVRVVRDVSDGANRDRRGRRKPIGAGQSPNGYERIPHRIQQEGVGVNESEARAFERTTQRRHNVSPLRNEKLIFTFPARFRIQTNRTSVGKKASCTNDTHH